MSSNYDITGPRWDKIAPVKYLQRQAVVATFYVYVSIGTHPLQPHEQCIGE